MRSQTRFNRGVLVTVLGALATCGWARQEETNPPQAPLPPPRPPQIERSVFLEAATPATLIPQGGKAEDPADEFGTILMPSNRATLKVPTKHTIWVRYHAFRPGKSIKATELAGWYAKSSYIGLKEDKPTVERTLEKRFLTKLNRVYVLGQKRVQLEVWVGPRGAWTFWSAPDEPKEPEEPSTDASFRESLSLVTPLSLTDPAAEPSEIPDIPKESIKDNLVLGQLSYKGPSLFFRSLIDIYGGFSLPIEGYYATQHQYAETRGLFYLPLVIESFGTSTLNFDPILRFLAKDRSFEFYGTPKKSPIKRGDLVGVRYELPTKNGPGRWTTEITAYAVGLYTFANIVTYRSDSAEWTRLAKEILDESGPSEYGLKQAEPTASQVLGDFRAKGMGNRAPTSGTMPVPKDLRQDVANVRVLEAGGKGYKLYGIEYELKHNVAEFDLTAVANDFEAKVLMKYAIEATEGDTIEYLWGPKDSDGFPTFGERRERAFTLMQPTGAPKPGAYFVTAYKTGNRVGVLVSVAEDRTKGLDVLRRWNRSVRWIVPVAAKKKSQ